MRLSKDTKIEKPYVRNAQGEWVQSDSTVTAHAGQYIITDPKAPPIPAEPSK